MEMQSLCSRVFSLTITIIFEWDGVYIKGHLCFLGGFSRKDAEETSLLHTEVAPFLLLFLKVTATECVLVTSSSSCVILYG